MAMSDPSNRPPFLHPPGSVLMRSPLALKNAQMFGFWVEGRLAALQSSLDETLNRCTQNKMRFKVLTPYVMLTFTKVAHASSQFPEDAEKGWGQETDIVTWVIVGEVMAGTDAISHVYFYPMHIWVNDAMALINGRELFGYPKYECTYAMPSSVDEPLAFSLAAKGFQSFAASTEMALRPLLEVNGRGAPRGIGSWRQRLEEMLTFLRSLPGFWQFGDAAWAQLIDMLRSPKVDQLFLKQFPDSSGERAVYQAIVTAPAVVQKVHSVHLFDDAAELNLHAFDSFPLDRTLGWRLGVQPALMPFAMGFDFVVGAGTEIVDNSVVRKKKIAILGGGVGAMSAAFWLTNQPDWKSRYEIDLYQMGWRLGGKGASGRNADIHERIEEHGLHVWFGFYDNAFDTIQQTYAELGRPAGTPLATWQDAFKPQHFISLAESLALPGPDTRTGPWAMWNINVPPKPGHPGKHSKKIDVWSALSTLLAWIRQGISSIRTHYVTDPSQHVMVPEANGDYAPWLHRLAAAVEHHASHLANDVHHAIAALKRFVAQIPDAVDQRDGDHLALLRDALRGLQAWIGRLATKALERNDALRRLFIMVDLGITCGIGVLEDGVLKKGFEAINDIDFYAWLIKHGANKRWTVYSAPVRCFYDLVFAYEDGEFSRPNIEAGTMLRGMMKVTMCYHGGIMYKMQAGMGDAVFAPMYEVLGRRGVRFHFFNKVLSLAPGVADSAPVVDRIELQEQVKCIAPYEPLRAVQGLDCWPSQPRYEFIDPSQAALLEDHGINLESHWSTWPQVYEAAFGQALPQRTLRRGIDFDLVVFGLSVGSLSDVAAPLLPVSPGLAACSKALKTVATQAYQVWCNKSLDQLGWTARSRFAQQPVLSAFSEPFDTWAPMDELIERERWPADGGPRSLAYFCSALPVAAYPPSSDAGFPAAIAAQTKQNAIAQLEQRIGTLWPNAVTPTGFDWSVLIDLNNGTGAARFDGQYWRGNVDPSERYVLSVVNSSQYRLRADQSGFGNLFLAGDWLKTGLDAGCVEAATMGGMQAARAIGGYPAVIRGEGGF
ncbi:NAD(P)-binding protein [Silanimonas sp.]|jgi:uncharacterized protein with NAD-binding domain and iron-sulfur cluster|uniref:NAD(P)-binding protein n=1 Tax=Silanimonas sp. TaxID=1929290 RepID=UPI0037C5415F